MLTLLRAALSFMLTASASPPSLFVPHGIPCVALTWTVYSAAGSWCHSVCTEALQARVFLSSYPLHIPLRHPRVDGQLNLWPPPRRRKGKTTRREGYRPGPRAEHQRKIAGNPRAHGALGAYVAPVINSFRGMKSSSRESHIYTRIEFCSSVLRNHISRSHSYKSPVASLFSELASHSLV
jgi:hypothetical protein